MDNFYMGKGLHAMKNKIIVAGNIIVDRIYPICGYPARGCLTKINPNILQTTGGTVCNTGMDLVSLSPDTKVCGIGCVGRDAEGDFAIATMEKGGLDCSGVRRVDRVTSFTAVMSDVISGERTFFTHSGASSALDTDAFDFDGTDANLFHIGYILLLDTLDQPDKQYGTKLARVLADAQRHGIKTSIDVVSENSDRFTRLVPPALKYTDYCIINEIETAASTGIPLRGEDGTLLTQNIPAALTKMHELGVAEWAVIHAPEGGYGMDKSGRYVALPSLNLPKECIIDKVGAGDAFCAGVLCGANEGLSMDDSILLGSAAAAMSLSAPGATDGVGTMEDAFALLKKYGMK